MEAFIYCKNLCDAIYSTKSVGEKCLRIDVAAIKQMLQEMKFVK